LSWICRLLRAFDTTAVLPVLGADVFLTSRQARLAQALCSAVCGKTEMNFQLKYTRPYCGT